MKSISLTDYIEKYGEERVCSILSEFHIKDDKDIERFIQELAIPYEKSGNSRTFIFMSDNDFVGYVSLALNSIQVPSSASTTLKRAIRGIGRSEASYIPCYLIGQIARFDGVDKTIISGDDILKFVSDKLVEAKAAFGGRILTLDCKDPLVKYYEQRGFKLLNKTGDLNQMILFIYKS